MNVNSDRGSADLSAVWNAVRRFALGVFVAVPFFSLFVQRFAGRVVWTIVVAALPLFFVLAGYYNWRRICPLAWFAQLPSIAGRPGQRRASAWLQANFYHLTLAIFVFSLWMRLIATNGDGAALAVFFTLLSLAALVAGAMYTGKTWCNYICPVSLVEKIYTEPRGLRGTANSQCSTCTACKAACPDINEENGYWRELASKPKRLAYFAFPGLVGSFYLYYFLQSGTWDYYFGGSWTNQPGVVKTAFLPGHDARTAGFFFAPAIPRAVAALATLILGALVSFAFFAALEGALKRHRGNDEPRARHLTFSIAAFVAFVTFYSFAGAPTLRLIPGATQVSQIVFVTAASLFLVRRITRRQSDYAEETMARQILRRWNWKDAPPPEDLHDAYLIHTIRTKATADGYGRMLEAYRDSVRDSLANALLTRLDVQRLDSLRAQLQISPADHEKIMAELAEEDRLRLQNPVLDATGEKRLQLEAYRRALRDRLERPSPGRDAGASLLHDLRSEYGVTLEEHAAVVESLLRRDDGIAPVVAQALETIECTVHTLELLRREAPGDARDFLVYVLTARRSRAADAFLRAAGCTASADGDSDLRDRLTHPDDDSRERVIHDVGRRFQEMTAAGLIRARRNAEHLAISRPDVVAAVRSHLGSTDPYLRAAALYFLSSRSAIDAETVASFGRDEHETVRETADAIANANSERQLITIERMNMLASVSLFAPLPPEELAALAHAAAERSFSAGEALCREGEAGDEMFIVASGRVAITRNDGSDENNIVHESVIGELAVLDPGPRAATVIAADDVRVLCLGGDAFRALVRTEPSMTDAVIRALVNRVRRTHRRVTRPATVRNAQA